MDRRSWLRGALGTTSNPLRNACEVAVDSSIDLRAREAIDRWEANSPVPDTPVGAAANGGGRSRWALPALTGVAVGLALSFALMRVPAATEGRDNNGDGVLDEHWRFSASGRHLSTEVDLDGDGVAHTVEYVDPITQQVARLEHLRLGSVVSADMDTDGDGRLDTTEIYSRVGAVTSRVPIAAAR